MGLDWTKARLGDGRYRIVSRLGEGGMGYIYRARDLKLDTDVVIKVPRLAIMEDPNFTHRFQREIRSLVNLSHPHIVKIMDVGEHGGVPFAVMQYLPGGDLEGRRARDARGSPLPQSTESLAPWLPAVAKALDYVHRQDYVHRDIKPSNILFDADGNPYLSDFGIAKVIAESTAALERTNMTGTGLVLGTPDYMAPELIVGKPFDGRADQYSLAMTVYELLAGRLPFTGPTPAAILVRQATEAVTPLHMVVVVNREVSQAVSKALSKDPSTRFLSCGDFAQAIMAATSTVAEIGTESRHHSVPRRLSNDSISKVQPPLLGLESASDPLGIGKARLPLQWRTARISGKQLSAPRLSSRLVLGLCLVCALFVVGCLVLWLVFRDGGAPVPPTQTVQAPMAAEANDRSPPLPSVSPSPPKPPLLAPQAPPESSRNESGGPPDVGPLVNATVPDAARSWSTIPGLQDAVVPSGDTKGGGGSATFPPVTPLPPPRTVPFGAPSTIPSGAPGGVPSPQADSEPRQSAVPAAAGSPFDRLPDEVDLDFAMSVAEESRSLLGPLTAPAHTSWSLTLDCGAANLEGSAFTIGEPLVTSDDTRWPIQLSAPSGADNTLEMPATSFDTSKPLAHVVVENGSLLIVIPPDKRTAQAAQLRNCVLSLSDGFHSHRMQLRMAQRLNALTLDLTEASTSVDLSLKDPPADGSLHLELRFAGTTPDGFEVDPPNAEAGLSKAVVLKLKDWPGAKIEVRVIGSAEQYRVRVFPTFDFGDRDQPLTVENINKTINRIQRQLTKNIEDYHSVRGLPSELARQLRTIRNTTPADSVQAVALATEAGRVTAQLQKAESQIRRLSETIPNMEQTIERLKTLGQVVDKLHGKLQIPIRVFAKTTGGSIELLLAN